jgi:hypothetical protein
MGFYPSGGDRRITYAVTSCNNKRDVSNGVLCGPVKQRPKIEEAVFSVGSATRLSNVDLTQLQELSFGIGSFIRKLRDSSRR